MAGFRTTFSDTGSIYLIVIIDVSGNIPMKKWSLQVKTRYKTVKSG